jgi:hypothetical protein
MEILTAEDLQRLHEIHGSYDGICKRVENETESFRIPETQNRIVLTGLTIGKK